MNKVLKILVSGLVSTAIIGTLGLGSIKALDKLDDLRLEHTSTLTFDLNRVSQYDTQFNTGQLFVPSNPRLDQGFETNGHAYVFVHTGSFGSDGYFRHGSADEYKEYLENVKQLIKELNNSGALVLYLIYDISGKQSEEHLELLDNPFVIVTEYEFPYFKRLVKTEDGLKEQREDLVYSFLRANGVKELRFAGEMVWWENHLACLGTATKSFYKNGFEIRGIEGGVFPTTFADNFLLNLDLRGRVEGFYDALGLHRGISNSGVMSKIYTNPVVLNQN